MTFNGTPVGSGDGFHKLLRFGKELLCQTIHRLRAYAPVRGIFIPGNHDRDSTLTLAEMVADRFADDDGVTIDGDDKMRKYYRWGRGALIGYTHGDVGLNRLAGIMPVERGEDYAQCVYRAWHTGHKHTREKNGVHPIKELQEENCVDVEIVPSLSPKDRWHDQMGFVGSMRRAKAFLYHNERGLEDEFWYDARWSKNS
jgi:hypothetical protein